MKMVGKVVLDNFSNEFHVFSIEPKISQNHAVGGKSYPGQLFIIFLVGNRRRSCIGQVFLPIFSSNRVATLFCRIIRFMFYWLRHRPYTQASTAPEFRLVSYAGYFRWNYHPPITIRRENTDYVRVPLCLCYTFITGCEVLLTYSSRMRAALVVILKFPAADRFCRFDRNEGFTLGVFESCRADGFF